MSTMDKLEITLSLLSLLLLILTPVNGQADYYFDPSTYNPGEADGNVELTIIKSGDTGAETTISIVTADGADAGDPTLNAMEASMDYGELVEGSADSLVTFPIGETKMTIMVAILDDVKGEKDEMFTVDLRVTSDNQATWNSYTTVTAGETTTATITITDNDPIFQIISPQAFNGAETDGYVEVTIEDTKADSGSIGGTVTLTASELGSVSAIEGSDFVSFTKTETFSPGEKYKRVQVPITDDKIVEAAETFELTLSSTSGEGTQIVSGMDVATLTIDDDDATVSMAVSAQDVSERDGSVEVFIKRDASEFISRAAWVDVEVLDATATAPEDFMVPDNLKVYFATGLDQTSITIPVVNDRDVEGNQTFVVRITDADNPIDTTADTTTITIQSDDALIWLVQTPNQVVEGEPFVATVMREGGDGFEHEVYVSTNSDVENAATAGTDFEVISMPITLAADEDSKTVVIATVEDDIVEETESFRVSLIDLNGVVSDTESELYVQILDDDSLVGFEKTSYEVTETTGSNTVVSVTLTRGGDTSDPLSVVLSTEEINGASAGDDFSAINSMALTFKAEQETISQEVTIEADNNPEFAETFQVIVRSDANGGLENIDPARSATTITILDDDSGSFRFENTEYSVEEGQGVLSATILRPGATVGYVDLLVTASPITATYPDDYLQEEVQVQFSPGQDSAPVQIAIVGDNDFREGDETFKISLSIESDFGTLDPEYDEATVTIRDSQSSFSLSTTSPTVVESVPGYVEITIRRSGSRNTDALVSLKTMDGTATHSGDFKGFNLKTFAFPSGTPEISFRIDIDDNDFREDREETFSVVIISADGEIMEDSSLTITIIDDDGYFSFPPTSTTDDDPLDDLVYYTTTEDGGPVTITVQRIGYADGYASVRATTVDDTANADDDYVPFDTRVINFKPAQATAEFTVEIYDDEEREYDESFFVVLSKPSNGVVVWPNRAKITIGANDRHLGTPSKLSTNSIIGIAVGVGGIVVIGVIAGIAFCLLLRPSQPTVKPPLPGPRPFPRGGIRPNAGMHPNPYQPQPQLYPQFRGYP